MDGYKMEAKNEDNLKADLAEIKKVLEDAHVFEQDMPKELMISYYKALRNSKNTASEEDQTRRLNQSQEELKALLDDKVENIENTPIQVKEKPFIPKTWTSTKKTSLEDSLERNNNENIIENDILEEIIGDSPTDATKVAFGFNEMGEDSEYTLNIITHELKFVPIQSNKEFLNAGTALKAKMLFAYHTKMNKMKTELARLSFYPAPVPKITSTTETFPTFSENNFPETYVCRSGRQTKRKIYNYDDDDDSFDGTSTKKVKNSEEEEWLNKPIQKIPVRSNKKQETNKVNSEPNKTELDIIDSNKEKKIYTKRDIISPSSSKLSNIDIMKRSNLFSDTPKRRCEKIFDRMKEEEEKKEREEKSMELFNKTLDKIDEENVETTHNDEVITVDDEESVRIRVVPQIPRKLAGRKRNNPEALSPLDVKIQTHKKDPTDKQHAPDQDREKSVTRIQVKRRPAIRKTATESSNSLPSTSRTPKTASPNNVICPICDGSFEEDKIVEHAATCGDEPVTRSSSKLLRITCEICDKVVDFDTNYEVHVKDCIKAKRDKD